MTMPDMQRPGAWQNLFPQALELMAELETRVPGIEWTIPIRRRWGGSIRD